MDKKTCREFLAMTWPQNSGWVRIVMFAVAGVSFVYSIIQLALFGVDAVGRYAAGISLMGCIALYLAIWGYQLRLNGYVKRQKQAWGDDTINKTVVFDKDGFTQTTRFGELRMEYGDVTRILSSRKCFVLQTAAGAILMKKDGFVDADYVDVMLFLQKKTGIKLGGKKKEK